MSASIRCGVFSQVIAGRHLFKQGKGIPSPFVEVEILGCYFEDSKKFKTEKKSRYPNRKVIMIVSTKQAYHRLAGNLDMVLAPSLIQPFLSQGTPPLITSLTQDQ